MEREYLSREESMRMLDEMKRKKMSSQTTPSQTTPTQTPSSVSYKDISSDYEATREPSFIEKLATNFASTAKDLNKEWS